MEPTCPSCLAQGMHIFYTITSVPVHNVMLLPTLEEAVNVPLGDIALGFCPSCGFIANTAYDPGTQAYCSEDYESTQAFSATFNSFQYELASRLVSEYDLHGKDILEIGCGQGEFLALLCKLGPNRGVGFDPANDPARAAETGRGRMTVIKDFYSELYSDRRADFVCCKMTLEHIPNPRQFVRTVRRSIGDDPGTTVFFQVPDVTRILKEVAFWDIFYEHCSYFSPGSLVRLFRSCGFEVVKLAREYGDQYIMIEARPGRDQTSGSLDLEDDLDLCRCLVADFSAGALQRLESWRLTLNRYRSEGKRAVIWGGGSKGVALLTTLKVRDEVSHAVDINPRKRGTYMAGTGQPIVAPQDLASIRPDIVLVMNPIYTAEIQQELDRLGISAHLIPVA